jgi:hypothetical protein
MDGRGWELSTSWEKVRFGYRFAIESTGRLAKIVVWLVVGCAIVLLCCIVLLCRGVRALGCCDRDGVGSM